MKCLMPIIFLGFAACGAVAQEDQDPNAEPTGEPTELVAATKDVSRYSEIWERSPFVVITDLSGKADDLTGRFVITGFYQIANRDVVLLFDRTTLERFPLSPGEERNGVKLESTSHEGHLESLEVAVSGGDGRELTLAYDRSAVPAGGGAAAPPASGPGSARAAQAQRPPQLPTTRPAQPVAQPVAQPAVVGGAPQGGAAPDAKKVIRRRVIEPPN